MSFSVFVDESPSRPTIPSVLFTFTSTPSPTSSPSLDKENVNPFSSRATGGPSKKRRYVREEGAGPLAAKRKVKAGGSVTAPVAAVGSSNGSGTNKKGDKKRKVLSGRTNSSGPSNPIPLVASDTLLEDALVNRRAIDLTVSPLADASEAYIGSNQAEVASQQLNSSTSSSSSVVVTDYFSIPSLPVTPEKSRSVSPLVINYKDTAATTVQVADESEDTLLDYDMLCLRTPLPPSPIGST